MRLVALAVMNGVLMAVCLEAGAAEPIGKAVSVRPALNASGAGGNRVLSTNAPIYFMDRLSTSSSGAGEFVFDDGTRLAISASARLTIDASIAPGSSKFKKLGLKAVTGSFRWVSGKSPSSAYKIQTPTASMAIRGTAFDITVRGGKTYVVLLNGNAQLCSGGSCQRLRSACDYAVAGGGSVSQTKPIEEAFKKRDEAARLFPYLANAKASSGRFKVSGNKCLDRVGTVAIKPRGRDKGSDNDAPQSPPPPPPPDNGPPPKP